MLLGWRKDSQHWEFPGGKHDPGESVDQACSREVKEETGLSVHDLSFCGYQEHGGRHDDGQKWLNMIFDCNCYNPDQLRQDQEPDKFSKWKWFDVHHPPLNDMWDVARHVYYMWLRWNVKQKE